MPALQLQATPIDTKGFQSLLSLVDLTANDSFELYYGLFMYNQVGRGGGAVVASLSPSGRAVGQGALQTLVPHRANAGRPAACLLALRCWRAL